jgi:hypothetical protein
VIKLKNKTYVIDKNEKIRKKEKIKIGPVSRARKTQSSWASRKRPRFAGLEQPKHLGLVFCLFFLKGGRLVVHSLML